jgi:alkylation response protein AidB-like acyl-CoA dehydrogenase
MTAADETRKEIRSLAAGLFERHVDPARLDKLEATPDRFDRDLWAALAESGLLGVAVPEEHGGLGLGMTELALVLAELGRAVAAVPLLPTAVAARVLAIAGTDAQRARWLPSVVDGSAVLALAVPAATRAMRAEDDGRLTGTAVGVTWAHVADAVVLPVAGQPFLVDPLAVTSERGETTAREVALDLTFASTSAEPIGGPDAGPLLTAYTRAALAAVQSGVTGAALQLTASYTSTREQFGKPLSTFQGVALKAADAYLDTTAIRATAEQAAWALDEPGVDPTLPVLTAAWWAAEAGQHCVHLTQHLHGGMGADVTYPVHRYFLWGKQIELMLGGASALLAELGDALADRPDAGDAITL